MENKLPGRGKSLFWRWRDIFSFSLEKQVGFDLGSGGGAKISPKSPSESLAFEFAGNDLGIDVNQYLLFRFERTNSKPITDEIWHS